MSTRGSRLVIYWVDFGSLSFLLMVFKVKFLSETFVFLSFHSSVQVAITATPLLPLLSTNHITIIGTSKSMVTSHAPINHLLLHSAYVCVFVCVETETKLRKMRALQTPSEPISVRQFLMTSLKCLLMGKRHTYLKSLAERQNIRRHTNCPNTTGLRRVNQTKANRLTSC